MIEPGPRGKAAAQECFQGPVEPLHHPAALGVVCSCVVKRDSKGGSLVGPDGGGELGSVVGRQVLWDAEPVHPMVPEGIDFHDLALQQWDLAVIRAYRMAISGLTLRDVAPFPRGPVLLWDLSRGYPRPVVPQDARRRIFDLLHGAHYSPPQSGVQHQVTFKF